MKLKIKMRFFRRKILFFLLCFFGIYHFIKFFQTVEEEDSFQHEEQYFTSYDPSVCKLPQLQLIGHNNSILTPFCFSQEKWGYVEKGYWHFNKSIENLYKNIKCSYRTIHRLTDFSLNYSSYTKLSDNYLIKDQTFEVVCNGISKTGRLRNYSSIEAQIIRKPEFEKNDFKNTNATCKPMNILLFSYDSVSRVSWQLRLKKTSEFMFNIMKFKIMKGMNIIGEGTPAFMIPVLTGRTEEELPSALKTDKNGKYVDEVYPFIWNELNKNGYATFFNEDEPQIAVFNYRMRGMKNDITTHYMRAFQQKIFEKKLLTKCATKRRHKKNIQLIDEFIEEYHGAANWFVFSHLKENSHEDNSKLHLYDNDLYEFLKKNYDSGNFENTAIFMYSDHGSRFNYERSALQGFLEERLPFFSVYLPESFRKNNEEIYRNLEYNSEIISSPFDVHATIRQLACLEPLKPSLKRSISFFDRFPASRTCGDCEISGHYCSCIEWIEYDASSRIARKGGALAVAKLNKLLTNFTQHCSALRLKLVKEMRFTKTKDYFNIRLKLETMPNKAIYEVLMRYKGTSLKYPVFNENIFEMSHKDFSRLDEYGSQASCFFQLQSKIDLRKFCYCYKTQHEKNIETESNWFIKIYTSYFS